MVKLIYYYFIKNTNESSPNEQKGRKIAKKTQTMPKKSQTPNTKFGKWASFNVTYFKLKKDSKKL